MTRAKPSLLIVLLLATLAFLLAVRPGTSGSGRGERDLTNVEPLGGGGGAGTLVIEDLEVDAAISSSAIDVTNAGSLSGGGGGGSGRAEFGPLTVRKTIDRSSPALMRAVASGTHSPTAAVTVFRPGTSKPMVVYELKDVIISGVEQAGSKETVSISYGTLTVTAGGSSMCWDLAGNLGC